MNCFVDTSAFYALMDADDAYHDAARDQWADLLGGRDQLVTTNYVLIETAALLQHRLGLAATRLFHQDVYPVLRVEWIGREVHEAAVAAVLGARRRRLSLVDCTSFDVMRRCGVRHAFAFDAHFGQQGFTCVPA